MNTRHKPLLLALLVTTAFACASNPPVDGDDDAADDDADDDDSNTEGATGTDGGGSPSGSDAGGARSDSGGGGGAAGTVDCSGDTPANGKDMLTTFEDGTVGLDMTGGWVGGFYIFNDKMNDATAQMTSVQEVSRCSDDTSKFAYCTKGSGFTVWGAGIGTDLGAVDMATMSKATVDLSAYKGVSFWAKKNGTGAGTAKVIVPDDNTSDEGKKCSNAGDAAATMKCDPFVSNITLMSTWTKHTITWDKLKQGGWGKAVPAFSANKVYGIQVQFNAGMAFDACFDHFVLVR